MKRDHANRAASVRDQVAALGRRSIVMVGLMGCGKSSVGRRLAARVGLPFIDADDEIERAAGKSIPDIFADYGEAHFRDREIRVIDRLLQAGPQVLATGGGAFMRQETRDAISAKGISLWLKTELPVLMARVRRREDRPLLQTPDPEATMKQLMDERYPVYALADITVHSRDRSHDEVVKDALAALGKFLSKERRTSR